MKLKYSSLIAGLALAASANLQAQDLFGSTNSATRSYNYAELLYLPDMETDLPLFTTLVVAVTDRWSIWGQYQQYDIEDAGNELGLGQETDAEFNASITALGVLYHSPFKYLADTDWVAGFQVGRAVVEVELPVASLRVETKTTVQLGYLGFRRTLAPKLEGEIGLDVVHDDGDFVKTGTAKLVYRVLPAVDVALGYSDIGEENNLGIGLRYTW